VTGNETLSALFLLAVTSLVADVAGAQEPAGPASRPPAASSPAASQGSTEARIAFADHGGIYNWQAVDDRTVLIQSRDRKWYKATLFSPCFDLPFAERLGFESNADGSFDKFSSIRVRSQNCPLVSLVPTAAPAKKAKSHKAAGPSMSAPSASSATNPQ
jgi:hypothetical protein